MVKRIKREIFSQDELWKERVATRLVALRVRSAAKLPIGKRRFLSHFP
jgi:hypothetical protein